MVIDCPLCCDVDADDWIQECTWFFHFPRYHWWSWWLHLCASFHVVLSRFVPRITLPFLVLYVYLSLVVRVMWRFINRQAWVGLLCFTGEIAEPDARSRACVLASLLLIFVMIRAKSSQDSLPPSARIWPFCHESILPLLRGICLLLALETSSDFGGPQGFTMYLW